MAGSLVVSDTTAITSLLKIGRSEILCDLFSQVLVPPAVSRELLAYHDHLPSFLAVQELSDAAAVHPLLDRLGAGEAEAIILAGEVHADLLLIDDRRGRAEAEHRGLRCAGLPAVLLEAKRQGVLVTLREVLDDLENQANLRLSASLRAELLRRANED